MNIKQVPFLSLKFIFVRLRVLNSDDELVPILRSVFQTHPVPESTFRPPTTFFLISYFGKQINSNFDE